MGRPSHQLMRNTDPARTLPFNLLPQHQDPDAGFVWGRHHRGYLEYCANRCPLSVDELMEHCGYKKREKFDYRRGDWNQGVGQIPLKYLSALDVDMDLLQTAVELDRREIDEAIERTGPPTSFVVRLMAAVCKTEELPIDVTEAEAIEYVKLYSMESGLKCMISFLGLKAVLFRPDGDVYTGHYYPEVSVKEGMVSFGTDGREVGTARVAG